MLTEGITNTETTTVTSENTAKALGSGTLDVFATPAMISLMEGTASHSVEKLLEEGQTTVGTELAIQHVAASPIGAEIRCESTLIKVDGRALTFDVQAFDNAGLIGKGTHQRFIVYTEKFLAKANAKLQ